MPRGGSDLLSGISFTVHLGQPHSAMLYHPWQTEQNLLRSLPETESAFGQHHIYMSHLGRLKIFTATIWALSFSYAMYQWDLIV